MKKILIEAATEAGKLLLENFQTKKASKVLVQKSKFDYSTQMDKMAEDLIIDILRKNGVKGTVITEEAGTIYLGDSDYTFYIDPLDGTINYSSGFPLFCTSIGVFKKNEIVFGVVYYPDKEELYVAERGKGAFLNGTRLHVNNKLDLANSTFDFSIVWDQPEMTVKYLEKIIRSTRLKGLMCAAVDTCFIAKGILDGVIYVWSNPIDLSAAVLVVKEAGGVVTDFNGKEWGENSETVVATNPVLHEKLVKLLHD